MKKAITRKQLAINMGISRSTFYRWLNEKDIELPKGLITPEEQEQLMEAFGFTSEQIKKSRETL